MRIIISLLVLFLAACVSYPKVEYYELDEAIATAETPEEKAHYEKVLERFERDAEKADALILLKLRCKHTSGCTWFCVYYSPQPYNTGREPVLDTLEKKVKWYRRTRGACRPQTGRLL